MRREILFLCGGEHKRWLQPTQGEIDTNIEMNMGAGPDGSRDQIGGEGTGEGSWSQMEVEADWESDRTGARWVGVRQEWGPDGGQGVGSDGYRGQIGVGDRWEWVIWVGVWGYLVLHPYLVPHPLSGTHPRWGY